MATSYKTPGVYIEEIPKFPPSIAPVETAIPAFIGYTEKAIRNGESLTNKSTRIESIAEYEGLFGVGPSQNVEVFLDNNNNYVRGQAETALYLYDSLRMFYANGGGKCFIVSVGSYPKTTSGISADDIKAGLLALEKEDEPTIIILPDAVSIETSGPYGLQQAALAQCQKLMDRVVLCDLQKATDFNTFDDHVAAFRTGIGINFLKYGAAYAPWVNADLPRQIWRKNLSLKRDGTGTEIQLESLTADASILNVIRDVRLAEIAVTSLNSAKDSISGSPSKMLIDALQQVLDEYKLTNAATQDAALATALQKFSNLTFATLDAIQSINTATYPSDTKFEIVDAIADYLANPSLKQSILTLVAHHEHLAGLAAPISNVINTGDSKFTSSAKLIGFADGNALLAAVPPPDVTSQYPASVDTNKKRADVARDAAYAAALSAITMFSSIGISASEFEKTLNDTLLAAFGQFKELAVC
jgi:uncharacterized protein